MYDCFLLQIWVFLSYQSGNSNQQQQSIWLRLLFFHFLMINSFTGAHNISVWSPVELSLVIVENPGHPKQGRVEWWNAKQNSWAFTAEVYVSFYCLLLEAVGTVAIKYLWYFGKQHPKMEVNNIYSLSQSFPLSFGYLLKGKKSQFFWHLVLVFKISF